MAKHLLEIGLENNGELNSTFIFISECVKVIWKE